MTASWQAPAQSVAVDGYDVTITDVSSSGTPVTSTVTDVTKGFSSLTSGARYRVEVKAFTRDPEDNKVLSSLLSGETNTGKI